MVIRILRSHTNYLFWISRSQSFHLFTRILRLRTIYLFGILRLWTLHLLWWVFHFLSVTRYFVVFCADIYDVQLLKLDTKALLTQRTVLNTDLGVYCCEVHNKEHRRIEPEERNHLNMLQSKNLTELQCTCTKILTRWFS